MYSRLSLRISHNRILKAGILSIAALFLILTGAGMRAAFAGLKVRSQVPDLCYSCHIDLKQKLSQKSVHLVFAQGQCGSCHDLHASDEQALVKESVNSLCLGCHKELKAKLEKGGLHTALSEGKCTDCHSPHSSQYGKLLLSDQKDLCWRCHKNTQEETQLKVKHNPFDQGACSTCHDPHASLNDYQLKESANKLCQKCHAPRCNVKGVSITHTTKNMQCIRCHAGHNSQYEGLFGPYGHPPFLARSCESCHNPIEPDKKITTWAKGSELCFSCHEKKPENFKEGDIHGTFSEMPCALCHEFHSADNPKLTQHESRVCYQCHGSIQKKVEQIKKSLGKVHKETECFNCHKPFHSSKPHYFKAEVVETCGACHKSEHQITHPVGADIKDPRDGSLLTCVSCHSMHGARAEFMLSFDRKRQLCIQCHKKA